MTLDPERGNLCPVLALFTKPCLLLHVPSNLIYHLLSARQAIHHAFFQFEQCSVNQLCISAIDISAVVLSFIASPRLDIVSPGKLAVNHALLLLSDSALPLGSFAFSSGLESYLAHHRTGARGLIPGSSSLTSAVAAAAGSPSAPGNSLKALPSFMLFLSLSLASVASTALPYVLAAHGSPETIAALDDQYDASLPCTVARRASIAQGRALLNVWGRSFVASFSGVAARDEDLRGAITAIEGLRQASSSHPSSSSHRSTSTAPHDPDSHPIDTRLAPSPLSSHFPPLWGAVTRIMSVTTYDAAYVFLLNHVKTVVSAAVRANVLGPYQAQAILVDGRTREAIERALHKNRSVAVQGAAQTAPVLDLWIGRHELLYSRIFNS